MAKRLVKRSKPYDATFKNLIEAHPLDALAFVGITHVDRVEIVDTDVSAIAAAVDKALKVTVRQTEFLVHLEFQSGQDAELAERLFWYNAVLFRRHRLPVQTVLLLLTPAADNQRITGRWEICTPSGELCVAFHYRVVRLWQVPVDTILDGGLGILPLAPLAAGAADQIEAVVERMRRRFVAEAPAEEGTLRAATYLLMGLRFDAETARRLILGGRQMRESSTYQAILEEGQLEGALIEARKILLDLGTRLLGDPGAAVKKKIDDIPHLDVVENLLKRIPDVASWQQLLPSAPKNGRRKKS
jgi:hypothetical protein